MARSLPLSWKELFRDTYSVKRKFWFDSKEMFIRFDRTTFYCKAPNEQEQVRRGRSVQRAEGESEESREKRTVRLTLSLCSVHHRRGHS